MRKEDVLVKLKDMLERGEIKGVLGFVKTNDPAKKKIYYTENPGEVSNFEITTFNTLNPVTFLLRLKRDNGKIACFLRDCEERALNVLVSEGKIAKDSVYVIHVPCRGALDTLKLKAAYGGDITSLEVQDDKVVVDGSSGRREFAFRDFLPGGCKNCEEYSSHADVIVDGDNTRIHEDYRDIKGFDTKTPEEKWEYFRKEFERCTRCYACRESCPMCYCEQCFVDSYDPLWVEPGLSISDIMGYHLIKMYHMAGRCTNCGTCERACPENIPLSLLTTMISERLKRDFNYISGLKSDQKVFLGEFHYEDREEFIR